MHVVLGFATVIEAKQCVYVRMCLVCIIAGGVGKEKEKEKMKAMDTG